MRTDRGAATRSSPSPEPIHLELYGPDGPDRRPLAAPGTGRAATPVPRRAGSRLGFLAAASGALVVAVALGVGLIAVEQPAEPARDGVPEPAPARERAPVETLPPAIASPLPYPGRDVGPGRYATDLLGVPIEFTIVEGTRLRTARRGTIVLSPVGTAKSNLEDTPHLVFTRLAGWNTPDEATRIGFQGVGGIDADDFERWAAENDVVVDDRRRTDVDGRTAGVYDLHVDPASALGHGVCTAPARPCFWFSSIEDGIAFGTGIRLDHPLYARTAIRMWLIGIPGEDPVLVQAVTLPGAEGWLDEVEATTMATMTIGETARELLVGAGVGIPAER